jgi:diguanylate cyclase (GGDEF)-like protein
MTAKEKKREFLEVLAKGKINSVYQPIISLENGAILGYEALSRADIESCSFTTEEMFVIAEALDHSWQLEELCRNKSIMNAKDKPKGEKLFLNVSPGIIDDEEFKAGVTEKILSKYNLSANDIVFEITERTSIDNQEQFVEIIDHYKNQNFQIAIDDFGAGYAGLNRLSVLHPKYIKIDMALVRDIDKDLMKQSLVEGFVIFCKNTNISLIAEGIETKEELEKLVELGVEFGQGYYIQKPCAEMKAIQKRIVEEITKANWKKLSGSYQPSFFGNVGMICKRKETRSCKSLGYQVFEYIRKNEKMTEVAVINEEGDVCGILTRNLLFETYGGRYGYDLHVKKRCKDIMNSDFLAVDEKTPIEKVSKMALLRPFHSLYDAVIVTSDGRYKGVVTVKDLLEAAIEIQVTKAVDCNPLTGLPGNVVIEKEVEKRIYQSKPYSIIYLDLDNFKAYNDAYGFNNGDIMIKTLVKCVHEQCENNEFKGHIGGDDFVVIADYWDAELLCNRIIEQFAREIKRVYNEEDWKNGFIISKNRNGFQDEFPIVTISIAVMDNKKKIYQSLEEFSRELAGVKKESKKTKGSSIVTCNLVCS